MSLAKSVFAAIALIWLGQQQSGSLTTGGIRYIFSNVDSSSGDGFKRGAGDKWILFKGGPVQIQSPEKGLTIKGQSIGVTWADLGEKGVEVRKGQIEGSGAIRMDDNLAQLTLEEEAKKNGKPAPPNPSESKVMQVDSDLISFAGSSDKGAITIPGRWVFRQTSKGFAKAATKGRSNVAFDQTIDATGSSAQINLVTGEKGSLDQVSTGNLDGPVRMKIVRSETEIGSSKISTTSYAIVADHIDLNLLTNPGMITAVGHVTLDSDDGERTFQFNWTKCVFNVDKNFQILGFKGEGTPGTATAKTKGGSN